MQGKPSSIQLFKLLNPHRWKSIKMKSYYSHRAEINEGLSINPDYEFQKDRVAKQRFLFK